MVAAILVGGLTSAALVTAASAQINGTPASVTSINSGGHSNRRQGFRPASRRSDRTAFNPETRFPINRPCCISPLFPVNPNPPLIRRHHHQRGQFFPGGGEVYVPYAYPVVGEYDTGDSAADQQGNQPEEDYRGGPTIFDRRGPGTPAASYADAYPQRPSRPQTERASPTAPPAEAPVPDLPATVLVFKDGHQLEVQNYAVIGDTLYDLRQGVITRSRSPIST